MDSIMRIDWHALFVPSGSILELVVRGVLTYLALFAVLRVLRREAGALGTSDLLVVVLIADAIQNGMSGDYTSITEGVVLVVTIVLCDFALDWLGFRVPWFKRILRPPPLPLIEDGVINRRNLRHEMITVDELRGLLREQGVEDFADVKRCCLEGDGHISVIQVDPTDAKPPTPRDRTGATG